MLIVAFEALVTSPMKYDLDESLVNSRFPGELLDLRGRRNGKEWGEGKEGDADSQQPREPEHIPSILQSRYNSTQTRM